METAIDILIIEDDPLHLEHLETLIKSNYPDFRLLTPCTSGRQTINFLENHSPHIVFFDIDLGDTNAFDVLKQIKNRNFEIIFTTAYNEFAIDAFRVHAADYLLKPILVNELIETIDRIINRQPQSAQIRDSLIEVFEGINNQFLIIKEKKSIKYIPISNILYLEAQKNYTDIFYLDKGEQKKITSTGSLSSFLPYLKKFNFIRIHSSFIINGSEMREFDKTNLTMRLSNGKILPVARSRRDEILFKN